MTPDEPTISLAVHHSGQADVLSCAKSATLARRACNLTRPGRLDSAILRRGFRHGAADSGSWRSLWLARVCQLGERSGTLVRWPWLLRSGLLRHRIWHRLFPVWFRQRGLLWCDPSRPFRLSGGREAGLRGKAGCVRRHRSGLRSAACRSSSFEPGIPSCVAPRLVKGLLNVFDDPPPRPLLAGGLRVS